MTDPVPAIRVEDEETRRRYVATLEGVAEEAELELSRVSEAVMIAAHTGVPDSMSGHGVGRQLVERLVADARAEGFRVIPLCPFVKAMSRRHPEWGDVIRR